MVRSLRLLRLLRLLPPSLIWAAFTKKDNEMTREQVTEHLANLEQKFSQLATEMNVLQGAIITDRYWLSLFDTQDEQPKKES